MKTTATVLGIMAIGAALAHPVLAADDKACLLSNRIWGWQAVNDRALLITDRSYARYTVSLSGGCINLDKYAGAALVVRTQTSLGCVGQGDRIAFNSPGLGPLTCFVTEVKPAAPAPAATPAPDSK